MFLHNEDFLNISQPFSTIASSIATEDKEDTDLTGKKNF